jgi:hypothetical protein
LTAREGFLLLLVVAAAFAAAFSFHVAATPAELHDPRYAAQFESARGRLPVLGAVRVRSDNPSAAHLIERAAREEVAYLVDPARAQRAFAYGALLYGTRENVKTVRDLVRQGELPYLPVTPDIGAFFRDKRGSYACDVVLETPEGGLWIPDEVPDAEITGEPVVRARERARLVDLPRALLLAVIVTCAVAFWRRTSRGDAEERLLAAVLPVGVLCAVGWGVDEWTVAAVVLAAAAPRRSVLLLGCVGLFFPSMVLKRLGLAFLLAGIARFARPPEPLARPRRRTVVLVLLMVTVFALTLRSPASVPAGLWSQPAATFVEPARVGARAGELRAAGYRNVVGDVDPVPPDPDLEVKRWLHDIYSRSKLLARDDPRFEAVARAAASEGLYWPLDLRRQLRTTDRAAVLWVQDEAHLADEEFMSAEAYRWRGDSGLRRDGKLAGLVLLVLAGLLLDARRQRSVEALVGSGIGLVVLVMAEGSGVPLVPQAWFPLLVLAAQCPSWAAIGGLAVAALAMPVLAWPAVALALTVAFAWLVSRPRFQ